MFLTKVEPMRKFFRAILLTHQFGNHEGSQNYHYKKNL